jgi:phosphatidylglycerophosphate synthase
VGHRPVKLIPSAISGLRIVIGLAFPWLPLEWRLPAALTAAVSDMIDGPVSRWLKADSPFGRLLDPIADKIFLGGVLATVLVESSLAWYSFVLVAARDLAVLLACAILFFREGVSSWRRLRARLLGKATTVLQVAFLLALVCGYDVLAQYLVLPTAVLGVAAVVDYLLTFSAHDGKTQAPG